MIASAPSGQLDKRVSASHMIVKIVWNFQTVPSKPFHPSLYAKLFAERKEYFAERFRDPRQRSRTPGTKE
jgi:hypothetical protein